MSSLDSLYNKVETALDQRIRDQGGEIPFMEEVISYAVLKGGRRFRPIISLLVADHLPFKEAALPAAMATEFIHAASLVADDLPSMDNASIRRERPATHTIYGESNAILATYALISDAFQLIGESASLYPVEKERGERLAKAVDLASKATGLKGLSGGQYLDLHQPPNSLEDFLELHRRKTAALFIAAFSLGWIFGGGDLKQLPQVEEAAHYFGLAFQLSDDVADEETDRSQEKGCNLCLLMGRDRVKTLLDETSKKFEKCVSNLGMPTTRFEELIQVLIC
jgi:geranylgeranyl diphosphate synthase type II